MKNSIQSEEFKGRYWIYENENGNPLFGLEKENPNGAILFKNGLAVSVNQTEINYRELEFEWQHFKKVPFNLSKIINSNTVWLTEDERTAEILTDILPEKHCSSAIPGGFSEWKKTYRHYFGGKTVVFLCGREFSTDRQMLTDLNDFCCVKIVRMVCKNVFDWIMKMNEKKSGIDIFKLLESKMEFEQDSSEIEPGYPLDDLECNDFGRRDSFLKAYSDILRNTSDRNLYVYRNGIWSPDAKYDALNYVENWIISLKNKYSESENSYARKELKTLMTGHKTRKIISMSSYDSKIRIEKEMFEANPYLINFENGTLDFSSDSHIFREHRPSENLLFKMNVHYNPYAECPVFMKFISDIFNGKQELIDYFQEIMGYFITGMTVEPIVMILYGGGKNGKSTVCNLIEEMTGLYAKRVRIQAFMDKSADSIPNDLASTAGKRIIIGSEMLEDQKLNESLLKDLTGNDKISARPMRKEFFEFKPVGKIILYGNHKPYIRGTDMGIKRRLKMFHLTSEFSNEKQDRFLPEKLRNEFSGICTWFLEGLKRLQKRGFVFVEPDEIKNNVVDLLQDSDTVGQFLQESGYVVTESENDQVIIKSFYSEYSKFCSENRIKIASKPKFSQYLHTRGVITKAGTNNIQKYCGIGKIDQISKLDQNHELETTNELERSIV